MTFLLKVYKDYTDDEPLKVFPVASQDASKVHDYWKNLGYAVGLYPQVQCGESCPFRDRSVVS